jgi:acetolactate synthase-1/2/3 large subunit
MPSAGNGAQADLKQNTAPARETDLALGTSAASVLLRALKRHGISYFFANPGTDFPPIVEAFAHAAHVGEEVPLPVVVPHENAAISMAHGVYMVSGRPQAVMVHVNVGTANTINCLFDARRDQVPVLLLAGQSPITEKGELGSRNRYIHWAQEMFDQAGMVREAVKWDYQLRVPGNVGEVVTRALEVAMTSPRGPVYVSFPREPLAASAAGAAIPMRAAPRAPAPAREDVEQLADWIAQAENPLVVTSSVGRHPADVPAFEQLVEKAALPVVCFNPRYMCIREDHPMHMGYQPGPLLAKADLVVAIDCDVPWIPSLESPGPGCKVVQVGEDPVYQDYPMRSFPSDLSITSSTGAFLAALEQALASRVASGAFDDRRKDLFARAAALAQLRAGGSRAPAENDVITPSWISRCIGRAIDETDIVVNEYPLRLEDCTRTAPGTYFGLSPAGGLGWGFGAALGAKLAAPDRTVVATLGDGAYIFSNPAACHWLSRKLDLPVLTVIFNNTAWAAVRNSTLAMYGNGMAAMSGGKILAELEPSLDFEKFVEAAGGHGERVERPGDLPAALQRVLHVVRAEKRQALLNVICKH